MQPTNQHDGSNISSQPSNSPSFRTQQLGEVIYSFYQQLQSPQQGQYLPQRFTNQRETFLPPNVGLGSEMLEKMTPTPMLGPFKNLGNPMLPAHVINQFSSNSMGLSSFLDDEIS